MKNLLVIFQVVIVLTSSSTLCLSKEWCCDKEEIYTGTKLPYSCKDILEKYPDTPSGYYLIQPPGYSSIKVYCDMENEHCCTKGWTRVAYVNMSDSTQSCPGNHKLISNPLRTCGSVSAPGCATASFPTHGISYSQVCGQLRGYQVGQPNAFGPYTNDLGRPNHILDGILISHGKAREFIWAYVTGFEKVPSLTVKNNFKNSLCPCTDPTFVGTVPSFIGNDYYCDSGVLKDPVAKRFYTTPIWTGEGCTPPNFCCSHSGMPWFCKKFPVPTTDYIEVRNCRNGDEENTALELIELYIR